MTLYWRHINEPIEDVVLFIVAELQSFMSGPEALVSDGEDVRLSECKSTPDAGKGKCWREVFNAPGWIIIVI